MSQTHFKNFLREEDHSLITGRRSTVPYLKIAVTSVDHRLPFFTQSKSKNLLRFELEDLLANDVANHLKINGLALVKADFYTSNADVFIGIRDGVDDPAQVAAEAISFLTTHFGRVKLADNELRINVSILQKLKHQIEFPFIRLMLFEKDNLSLLGVEKVISCSTLSIFGSTHSITSGGLGVMAIKGLITLITEGSPPEWLGIIRDRFRRSGSRGILDAQEELIEAGFEEHAVL